MSLYSSQANGARGPTSTSVHSDTATKAQLERTGSEILGSRLRRLPPKGAHTLHRQVRADESSFILEDIGRRRVGEKTFTVPRYGGVLGGSSVLRQVFNDSDIETLWPVAGAPDKEFDSGPVDLSQSHPVPPTQLPPELQGVAWPPQS